MTEQFRLHAEELKRLAEDGYVVREGVFTARECQQMAKAVEQLERDLLAAKRNTKHVFGSYMFELQRELQTAVKWEPQNPDVVQGIEPFAHISKALNDWLTIRDCGIRARTWSDRMNSACSPKKPQ